MKKWISDPRFRNSSIGVGTYAGSLDARDDILQFNAIIDSVMLGVNVIDTCANFRGGRSEMVVGGALKYLMKEKNYERSQILVSSKAGFGRKDEQSGES
jgi:aryl-alcohol dehydrogenase-like predicted oxidoreductase